MFARHHYLNGQLGQGARSFLATWRGVPVAFCATLALIGLGYGRPQAAIAVSRALATLGAEAQTAALIKAGLKALAQ